MDGCPPLFGPGFDADPYPVLLAVLAPRGSADLIAELAYPLPIAIICDCWAFRRRTGRISTGLPR